MHMSNMDSHLEILQQKHSKLENDIHEESLRPHPDDIKIKSLKLEKLKLKEEIEQIKGQ